MKILVIDDQALVRKAVKKVLEKGGYEVIRASSGKEGIENLREIENIDLIILDVEMPDMNGFDTFEKIQSMKLFSNIPIIFFTANDRILFNGERRSCEQTDKNLSFIKLRFLSFTIYSSCLSFNNLF